MELGHKKCNTYRMKESGVKTVLGDNPILWPMATGVIDWDNLDHYMYILRPR